MKRVFISYSRNDREFARRLAKSLAEVGADVWIDYEDIPAGKKWSTAIQQGLDSSDGLLVLVSPDAMSSSNVEDEWQYFLDSGKPVIPILYKAAKLHFQLHRLQYIDFTSQRFGDAFAKLLDELTQKGIAIQVESAEDTWVYEVKRSKPPKKELEYIEDSKKATFPSIKVKKPILQKPQQETVTQKRSLLLIGLFLILLAVAVVAFLLISPNLRGVTHAQLSDFAQQPASLYFYNENFQVHEEANGDEYDYFDSIFILERFIEDGDEWFQLEDEENGDIGYQTESNLPPDYYLLRIVPFATNIPDKDIRLYTMPSLSAGSYPMEVEEHILVYGFRYDDAERLWYYLFVEMNDESYMGWLPMENDSFSLLGNVPAIAYTTSETEAHWSEDLDEVAFTIPNRELLYIVGQADNAYLIAYYYNNEDWGNYWVDGANLDINTATSQSIEQK